jgi:hypothetical protein
MEIYIAIGRTVWGGRMKRQEKDINISGKFLWSAATYSFLEANLSTAVSSLNLATCHVNAKSARLTVEMIRNPESLLQTLILDRCRLVVTTSIIIFQALPGSKIRRLSMDSNHMSEEACQEFAM